jgi:hypothetical protein
MQSFNNKNKNHHHAAICIASHRQLRILDSGFTGDQLWIMGSLR